MARKSKTEAQPFVGWGKVPAIAAYLGLSERTVRELLKQGMPHIRLGSGTILGKFSEIDEFMERFRPERTESRVDQIVREILG